MDKTANRYLSMCYSGKQLLKYNNLTDYGIWEIRGEDPNPDWGGYHSNPYIATVEGTLKEVVEKAVKMPDFWTWGSGGKISKIIIQKPNELNCTEEIKERALAKLTNKEKEVLGLK